jgi:PTH1 family peptidyl-tRNA hydrolase
VGEFAARCVSELAKNSGAQIRLYPLKGFMNESGAPVRSWLKLNNVSVDEVVVAHDDSDLPLGTYKLVRGGGSAGHKGIESLLSAFGTPDFWRLRIGVRDPNEQVRKKAFDFVLSAWSAADEKQFVTVCERAWPEIARL